MRFAKMKTVKWSVAIVLTAFVLMSANILFLGKIFSLDFMANVGKEENINDSLILNQVISLSNISVTENVSSGSSENNNVPSDNNSSISTTTTNTMGSGMMMNSGHMTRAS